MMKLENNDQITPYPSEKRGRKGTPRDPTVGARLKVCTRGQRWRKKSKDIK